MDDLLEILENNARISLEDLQKLTGKSKKDIEKAMKNYEKKGVIVKYKTIINKQKTNNKGVVALIEVKIAPQKDVGFDLVAQRIYRFPEVKSCFLLSGTYDLLLEVCGEDINTVASFVAEKLSPFKLQLEARLLILCLKSIKKIISESKWSELFSEENGDRKLTMFLLIDKQLKRNLLGEWGIKNWRSVSERGNKEKAYLVLRKKKKPLHFKHITDHINLYWNAKKPLYRKQFTTNLLKMNVLFWWDEESTG